MQIADNVLRHYLRNVYFINGTPFAGKSTMCKMLAEKYGLYLCEDLYMLDRLMPIATQEEQPNLCYFKTKKDWQEYLNRTPDEYAAWIRGNSWESAGFEVAELIRISANQKVIVDTDIPCELLMRITDYHHVAVMLASQSIAVDNFFDRDDHEKQFLLHQIRQAENPAKTMANFRACIGKTWLESYDSWLNSGFYTIIRKNVTEDTRQEVLAQLAEHFGLVDHEAS